MNTIIEINNHEEFYFIITNIEKVIAYFYVNWRPDCNKFDKSFIKESRKIENIGITFCHINTDLLPDIQVLYDVTIKSTPAVVYIHNKKIVKRFEGNKPELLDDYTADFINM